MKFEDWEIIATKRVVEAKTPDKGLGHEFSTMKDARMAKVLILAILREIYEID